MRLYISCLAENIDVSFSVKQFASLANWIVFALVVVKCTWEFSGSIDIQQVLLFGNSLFVILTIMQYFLDWKMLQKMMWAQGNGYLILHFIYMRIKIAWDTRLLSIWILVWFQASKGESSVQPCDIIYIQDLFELRCDVFLFHSKLSHGPSNPRKSCWLDQDHKLN